MPTVLSGTKGLHSVAVPVAHVGTDRMVPPGVALGCRRSSAAMFVIPSRAAAMAYLAMATIERKKE